MRTSIILGTSDAFAADGFRLHMEAGKIADSIGVDVLTMPEHLAMSNNDEQFIQRYGDRPPVNSMTPFAEPMVFLGALSSVTNSIKLGTSIILSPLRSALAMAKQMATLDYMSGGRTIFGLGAGWQKEEFDACNMPWNGRHRHLIEQIQAFRSLWSETPAGFQGEFINFEDLNCLPFPAQGKEIPLTLGIAATERNVRQMAELGVGWIPFERNPEKLAEPIRRIKEQYRVVGRNEADLEVMAFADFYFDDNGQADLDKALSFVPRYAEIGVTTLQFAVSVYCDEIKDYGPTLERIERAVKG